MSDSLEENNNNINNNIIPKNHILDKISVLYNCVSLYKLQLNDLQTQIKTIEKYIKKELKDNKSLTKTKIKGQREPSGFAKPGKVSKELCEFLDKPEGSEIARTEVTKFLSQYIKQHKLILQKHISSNTIKNGTNVRKKTTIVPDEKLRKLLNISDDELANLDYFNIQKFMNKHFIHNISLL